MNTTVTTSGRKPKIPKSAKKGVIKLGIAALGRSGWCLHALSAKELPELYQVVAVADQDPERRREAEATFGCRSYVEFEQLLADDEIEVLVIATPTGFHVEHTIAALKAGKHVICEKPMAPTVAEADRMISEAKKANRILAVFQNNRYSPSFRQVQKIIASGKLGRIVQVRIAVHGFGRRWDWQTLKKNGGGELRNTGPHFIDHALEILGPGELNIFADLQRTLTCGDAEDHVKIVLKTDRPSSPVVDIEISKASPFPQNLWHIMGTRGGLTGTADKLAWKYTNFNSLPERKVDEKPTEGRSYNSEVYQWTEETWEKPSDLPSIHVQFYQDFYKTLQEGASLEVTPEQVRRQIWVIEQAHKLSPAK